MTKRIHFNGISIEEMSDFLIHNGFTVGSNKPSEYISRGLVLSGMRNIDNGGSKAYKSYYSLIVLVEFMTASLLKKGNWLELDPRQTHTKLTDRDVFYGRLAFYRQIYNNPNLYGSIFGKIDKITELPLRHFFTEVSYWFPKHPDNFNEGPVVSIYMEQNFINNVLNAGKRRLQVCFRRLDAVEAYIEWAKWQYGLTFIHVFEKYGGKIFSLPLTRAVAKVEEAELPGNVVKTNRSPNRL